MAAMRQTVVFRTTKIFLDKALLLAHLLAREVVGRPADAVGVLHLDALAVLVVPAALDAGGAEGDGAAGVGRAGARHGRVCSMNK